MNRPEQAPQGEDWKELRPLDPFFRKYIKTFTEKFIKHYQDQRQIDPGRDATRAVSHIFIRHFIPDLNKNEYPEMTGKVAEAYRKMVKEQQALSLTLIDMMRDISIYQNESNTRQLSTLQRFISVHLPTGAPDEKLLEEASTTEATGAPMAPIMSMLQKIQAGEAALKCHNLYQNVPIVHTANVVDLHPETQQATFRFSRYQAAIIRAKGFTYFKSDAFPGTVMGSLVAMNEETAEGVMSRFHLANMPDDHRENVRVEPAMRTPMTVVHGEKKHSGELIDLSLAGVGVRIARAEIPLQSDVELVFNLPPDQDFFISGKMLATRNLSKHLIAGISMILDPDTEGRLSEFIRSRQIEVVTHLKKITDAARFEKKLPRLPKSS